MTIQNEIRLTIPDLPAIEEYLECMKKIWANRWITNDGEFVQLLEAKLRSYLEIENLAIVSNGTLAMHIALKALELKGEIITTPFTFAATTNVIVWEGLRPVFSDIDPQTFNIDPMDAEKRITEKTSAILAVHTFGNPCDVEELQKIAEKHNIKLIYDSAHAFGVQFKDLPVVSFGDISTLSFYATKVYNTIEGGAIICKDKEIHEKIRLLRNHGIKSEEEVLLPGTNAKMDEFRAAMGLCNLKTVYQSISKRRILYEYYKEELSGCVQFQRLAATKYNFAYMPVCFKNLEERNAVYSELIKNGILPRKYFFPLTTSFAYFDEADRVHADNLEKSIDISNRVLCLPLYPDLEIRTASKIVEIIKANLKP